MGPTSVTFPCLKTKPARSCSCTSGLSVFSISKPRKAWPCRQSAGRRPSPDIRRSVSYRDNPSIRSVSESMPSKAKTSGKDRLTKTWTSLQLSFLLETMAKVAINIWVINANPFRKHACPQSGRAVFYPLDMVYIDTYAIYFRL